MKENFGVRLADTFGAPDPIETFPCLSDLCKSIAVVLHQIACARSLLGRERQWRRQDRDRMLVLPPFWSWV